jgi:ankyrin repeat protein
MATNGVNALISACRGGYTEVVEVLLATGLDVHHVDNEQGTALMAAASKGYIDLVSLLITHGANVSC